MDNNHGFSKYADNFLSNPNVGKDMPVVSSGFKVVINKYVFIAFYAYLLYNYKVNSWYFINFYSIGGITNGSWKKAGRKENRR